MVKHQKKRSTRGTPRVPSKALVIQQKILESNVAQQTRPVLVTPDVPRLRLKRLKSYTISAKISLSTATQFGVYTFDFVQFPNADYLCHIFDEFRVAQLQFDFYPIQTAASIPSALVTSIDYTDNVAPTAVTDILDSETALVVNNTYFGRTLAPKYTMPNSATGDLASISSNWIPCQNGFSATTPLINDTTWVGLKYAYMAPLTNPIQPMTVFQTMVLNFRVRD